MLFLKSEIILLHGLLQLIASGSMETFIFCFIILISGLLFKCSFDKLLQFC